MAIVFSLFFSFSVMSWSAEPVKVEPGANYEKYSDKELRQRVWQLEQAVQLLQSQLAAAAANPPAPAAPPEDPKKWRCELVGIKNDLEGFGPTRYMAVKELLRKCRELGTMPLRCQDTAAKCVDSKPSGFLSF